MKNWWKGKFAGDRWVVLRLTYWAYGGRRGVRETKVHAKNRYSGKLKTFELDGEFLPADFPNGIYRG